MRESRTCGSERGAPSNGRPYREKPIFHRKSTPIAPGAMLQPLRHTSTLRAPRQGGAFPVSASPARHSLQPEATGDFADMEVYGVEW